jgi:hypothetical protein
MRPIMNRYKGISADDKHRIVNALKARGAGSCPRCADSQWTVSEFSMIEVQATMDRNAPLTTTIPSIMIVCEHCGFIAQHALQPLGVWPVRTADLDSGELRSPRVASA